jgi:YegS/Rv2252/BmrU family lipid kinase
LKKYIKFIINPVSGGKNKSKLPEQIRALSNVKNFESDIKVSNSTEETIHIAQDAVEREYNAIIAVGGDGTINNVAAQLIDTETALGIIPMGSGNGLSRALKIPFDLKEAMETVYRFNKSKLDNGFINDTPFFNLAGVGFDAHVAGKFQGSVSRGFSNYIKITISEFNNYVPHEYEITVDGVTRKINAFLLTVNNGTQFGNNAYTAPNALLDDGLLNVMIIKKCSWINIPSLAYHLFNKTIHKHPFVETFSTSAIKIKRLNNELVNIDGEPIQMGKELDLKISKSNFSVIH